MHVTILLQTVFPSRVDGESLCAEADQLEHQLGLDAAIQSVRAQITAVGRDGRKRLYRLHDELARRLAQDLYADRFGRVS